MSKFVRKSVDTTIENNIVTAAIISTRFLEETYSIFDVRYMKNSFAKILMNWTLDYFEKFGEAPRQNIQKIYEIEKAKLEETDSEIIGIFLSNLSKTYVEDQGINEEYILREQAMPHFRKREIEISLVAAQNFLDVGKVERAEEVLTNMKRVMLKTSNWCNPLTTECITEVFDDSKKGIFRFPGALGDMLGDLERGWLIAFLAPFKRGKTWLLQEAVVIAALLGLKAVFVSLEMQNKNINERLYKRITAYGEEGKSEHAVPVFDCVRNQDGTCSKVQRKNKLALYDGESPIPDFDPAMDYRPCSYCKDVKAESADYEMATWFEVMKKPEFTARNVNKKLKAFTKFYGDNIRVICYPRFSATVADLERDLDLLEEVEGFIPDLIAADYADIFRPDNRGGTEQRHGIDEIWKSLAAMMMRRHAIGFTASQGNRGSIYKENMDQTDLAEWIGKLAHVDKFAAVNQSLDEKRRGIIRIGMMADRHKEFHEKDQVLLLQALALGQVHLDSHSIRG